MEEILEVLKKRNKDEKFKGCFEGSISNKIAWIDTNMKAYFLKDLTDEHLQNILNFMFYEDGGYPFFITKRVMKNLYKESVRRKIAVDFSKTELIKTLQ